MQTMNMTVVLVSKRSFELLLVCLSILSALVAVAPEDAAKVAHRVVDNESHELTGQEFSSIVQDFGESLSNQMEQEMNKLISSVEQVAVAGRGHSANHEIDFERLKDAHKSASEDIKTRIELVGDQGGALPQASLGGMASSFLHQANSRLQSAGSYIGNKMRSLGNYVAPKIPPKLRRLFRWPSFLKFKLRFNKVYKSMREEVYRQMVFLRTHIVVGVQRIRFFLGRDKHLLGPTQYADWTLSEYDQKLNNRAAEKSPAEADPSVRGQWDERYKSQLETLKAQGKNVFGVQMELASQTGPATTEAKKRPAGEEEKDVKRLHRTKRDADGDDDFMDAENELDEMEEDEEEEEEYFSDMYEHLEPIAASDDEDEDEDDDDLAAEKLIEQFANAELGQLDDLSSTVDEALPGKQPEYNPIDEDDIPEMVDESFVPIDLRQTGCVIRPENQEDCGSCYAFALNAAASYYNCMESFHEDEKLVRYHPFYTAECGRYMTPHGAYPLVNGCKGGRISKAFQFTQKAGVQRYTDYSCARQSVGKQVPEGVCVFPRPAGDEITLSSLSDSSHEVPTYSRSLFVNMKLREIDLHLRTVGPVFVNIRTWKDFELMQAGIYGGVEESDMPGVHSMLIVGHDKDCFNRDYWVIWNSYGVNWGERGFIRLYTRSLKHFTLYVGGLQPAEY